MAHQATVVIAMYKYWKHVEYLSLLRQISLVRAVKHVREREEKSMKIIFCNLSPNPIKRFDWWWIMYLDISMISRLALPQIQLFCGVRQLAKIVKEIVGNFQLNDVNLIKLSSKFLSRICTQINNLSIKPFHQ